MRKSGSVQHYFTVRGRGFDLKQWTRILSLAQEAVKRAKKAGLAATYQGDAQELVVGAPGVKQPLRVVRKGEPNIPKLVVSEGLFDVLVQTILTAIKKTAPDIFEVVNPEGHDYRRLLANSSAASGEGAWGRMTRQDQLPKTKQEAFLKAMGRQKWRHPDTGNQVEFVSLPKKEQTKLRRRWEQEFGDRYQRTLDQAREDVEDAAEDLKKEKSKAEKAKGLEEAYEKSLPKKARRGRGKDKPTMDEKTIWKGAVRVAHTTKDPELKRTLLEILRPTAKTAKDDGEKKGRHEEGKSVDVGKWLKQHGYAEAAKKWESHEGEIGKKASVGVVFPAMRELAWKHVLSFARTNPESKVASGSTADRVSVADHLARKWVAAATADAHKFLSASEEDLEGALAKAASVRNTKLLYTLHFARELRAMSVKTSSDDTWLNEESFAKAAAEVWGSDHLAKKWISDAIKRPGRVRKYLGIPEGEDIPAGKIDEAIEKLKGSGNKSLLSALLLAKRLKKMHRRSSSKA